MFEEELTYIHHAGIVNVYPECKLLLMGEVLQIDRGKFPQEDSENSHDKIIIRPSFFYQI